MLTRRAWFLSAAAALPITAQNAAPPILYRTYSRCLPDYLRRLAGEAYQRRNQEIAKLTTPAAIAERQRWARNTFWRLAGGEPERTPLNAKTTGSADAEGFRLEKVIFESQPSLFVSANLYIPKTGQPPYPGVLFQMGHSPNGKANVLYQRCCQGLAKLGYLVLAFDPMGQGERTNYPGPKPFLTRLEGSADDEHTVPGKQLLLVGDSATRLQTWDAVRALDYLESHPLVDRTRLASTGQSGGGTNTMLLAAVDDRLQAAAIACANTENVASRDYNPPGATDDAEQNFPGSGPLGFDRWDLLYPLAGKPLLVLPSAHDFSGTYSPNYIENGWEEFEKLRRIYGVLGYPERIAWHDSPLPHGLMYGLRLAIYNWFERWLKQSNREIREEPPTEPLGDEKLFAAPRGSVVIGLGGITPRQLALQRIKPVSGDAPANEELERLLRLNRSPKPPAWKRVGETRFRHVRIEAIEIASVPEVWLPAWLYLPQDAEAKSVLMLLDPAGRSQWQEGALYDQLAQLGHIVCALDVRGIGDLTPEYSRGAARHARSHHSEQHYAWASLTFGAPLLGQRVTDILAAIQVLDQHPDLRGRRIHLAARGKLTVPAMFAAALDPHIRSLYLAGGLLSYRNILETEEYLGGPYFSAGPASDAVSHFANFIPGLLNVLDLPDLVRKIAPRRVVLAGAIDAAGNPVPVERVHELYEGTRNVSVQPQSAWTGSGLAEFATEI